jgi:SWI/SNF-related matrix-associated actin-dependent regulator of chromatin subfamily A3
MDRVHRLGQSSDVTAFRYIASDTIEERMLELQARKRDMASAMFERTRPEDGRQIRIDDVKLLMRL